MPTTPITKQVTLPLGIHINNPGNIEVNINVAWHGQTGAERGFCIFDTAENGLRAMMLNLRNMQRLHDCQTLTDIITRYAPPIENDTAGYIRAVSDRTGYDPDAPINLEDFTLVFLAKAMVVQEQGSANSSAGFVPPYWYPDALFLAAYKDLPA